ncbi:MAG TPA: response regulator [Xanthobacteraceae bacterium]|jgi:FixJ family two-component response regulator|nr:response regulator [Xanthobacteraceae bacterium]
MLYYWTMAQLDARHNKFNINGMAKNPRSIAIVDDDPSVLKALARLLATRSFAIKTYLSAPQFLASLPEGLPDCLIADLQMPEMTGMELQLNLARRGVPIPTIIITAHDEAGMRERCKSAGAVAYLSKPVSDTALFAAIESAVKRPDG